MIAIGLPGTTPRVQLQCRLDKAAKHLAPGEVALPIDGPGDYLIAANGLSVGPRPVPLDEQRKTAWLAVKARRSRAESGGCNTPSGRVQTDATSIARIGAAALDATIAQAKGQPYSVVWTMADNSTAELDAAGMSAINAAVYQHLAACHERSQALRAAIEEADAMALAALDLTAGWPV